MVRMHNMMCDHAVQSAKTAPYSCMGPYCSNMTLVIRALLLKRCSGLDRLDQAFPGPDLGGPPCVRVIYEIS